MVITSFHINFIFCYCKISKLDSPIYNIVDILVTNCSAQL